MRPGFFPTPKRLRPKPDSVGPVIKHTENWPNGKLKAEWSTARANEGQTLLEGPQTFYFESGAKQWTANFHLGKKDRRGNVLPTRWLKAVDKELQPRRHVDLAPIRRLRQSNRRVPLAQQDARRCHLRRQQAMRVRHRLLGVLVVFAIGIAATLASAQTAASTSPSDSRGAWLFIYFKEPTNQGIYFALSRDGLHYTPLNASTHPAANSAPAADH